MTRADQLRELFSSDRNRYRLAGVVLSFALFGGILSAIGLSDLLRYVLGLAYLSFGVFLYDIAQTIRFGGTAVRAYPGANDIWGTAERAVAMGLFAGALWAGPLLFDAPTGELVGAAGALCTSVFVPLFIGQSSSRPRLLTLGLSTALGFCSSWLLRVVEPWAVLFAPLSVASALTLVLVSSLGTSVDEG